MPDPLRSVSGIARKALLSGGEGSPSACGVGGGEAARTAFALCRELLVLTAGLTAAESLPGVRAAAAGYVASSGAAAVRPTGGAAEMVRADGTVACVLRPRDYRMRPLPVLLASHGACALDRRAPGWRAELWVTALAYRAAAWSRSGMDRMKDDRMVAAAVSIMRARGLPVDVMRRICEMSRFSHGPHNGHGEPRVLQGGRGGAEPGAAGVAGGLAA